MKDLNINSITSNLSSYGEKAVGFIGRYRTILTLLVASGAIFAAVIQAQSYLSPTRDEVKYSETRSQVNVKSIDEETLQKLEKTQEDRTNSVDSNFVPGRVNPFAE